MNKFEMLQLVAEKISKCEKCPELVATRIKTVPGQGNPDTKIAFLGEGPGRTESETGIAFCGQAEQLLDNILKACDLHRDRVFIFNIVKCRPPQNRVPTSIEAANCRSFLDLQIKIIQPKYIICLGNSAANYLLGVTTPVSEMRGQWFEYKSAKVIATFHPSYGLRVSSAKHEIYKDLMIMVEEIKKTAT